MQRAADKSELKGQPQQKKTRFVCYPDRVTDGVRLALYDARDKVPTLGDQPIVIWCFDDNGDRDAMALLYWPCDQLIGEQLVRAVHDNSDSKQHARLVEDLIEMALGYLCDYKAAKPTLPGYTAMKQRMVARFLNPGQPLSALGQLALLAAESVDTQPYDWSKHGNGVINESALNPHLFHVHCHYRSTVGPDNAEDSSDVTQ